MPLLMAHGHHGQIKEYDMISKEEKVFIINGYLKNMGAEKIMLNDKITPELTQEEIAEINLSIDSIDQKIQAIESEKTKIEQGE
jgi:hypothetical protein